MTVLMLVFGMFAGTYAAAQEPKVRASMAATDAIYVGQKATLVVELLAPGFFASAATFDLPDPQGLILIPPVGSPVVNTEEIEGTSYAVQRHEVSVLAERVGDITIPPLSVRFRYKRMPLDKKKVDAEVKTQAVVFKATAPPGTEKLGRVISARNLEATETWKPEPGTTKAKAGDAFTRTITFTAPDVPGMMFPPFPAGKIEGLGIYQKKPEVLDKSDRGSITGTRREVFTYACERAGNFNIPAARLTWWDLEAKQLRTVDFPAHTLEVAPNPALETTPGAAAIDPGLSRWAKGAIALFVALLMCAVGWRRRLAPSAGARDGTTARAIAAASPAAAESKVRYSRTTDLTWMRSHRFCKAHTRS